MIRCVRIWTAKDGNSQFEEGTIDLPKGERGDILGDKIVSSSISFRETKSGGTFAPHDAPTRQFVITLSGTLNSRPPRPRPSSFVPVTFCWRRIRPAPGIAGGSWTTNPGAAPM
jgi:hypothetical protein